MRAKRWPRSFRELVLIPDILLWFLAALVPIMFLFSVIAGFDQAVQHRGLLADLDAHGLVISAEINKIDFESQRGRITLFHPAENGQQELAVIRLLEFYPADWLETLEKDKPSNFFTFPLVLIITLTRPFRFNITPPSSVIPALPAIFGGCFFSSCWLPSTGRIFSL